MPALPRQVSRGAANGEKWFAVLRQGRMPRVRIVRQEQFADSPMPNVSRNCQR